MSDSHRERQYWERHARKYDATMGPLGRPLPRMLDLVGEAVSGAGHVLEVAAGTGIVTPVLAENANEVVATDYSSAMVAQLKARVDEYRFGNVCCAQADLYALPFGEATFDAVAAANVLHLVPDLSSAVAALRRVLKPNGRLIAPTFCHDKTALSWFLSRVLALTGFPGHRRFTTRSLQHALESHHIEVTRVETISGLLPIGYVEGIPR